MSRPATIRSSSQTHLSAPNNGFGVLQGKIAIVTGASRGIGYATAIALAKAESDRPSIVLVHSQIGFGSPRAGKGCNLIMNYTSDSSRDKTTKLADELQSQFGIQCLTVQADMGTENGPAHIVNIALSHFAHPKTRKLQIDILINNAGIGGKAAIEDCTANDFTRFYNVNVRGPLLLVKAALPYLPHDRSGRIVNLSSVSASLGFHEDGIYGGTKAALEAMTRTWARELSERATVNAVNPGPVATDMYSATSKEFQQKMSYWTRNTPLAAIRSDVDRQDLVENADIAGGRPGYDHEVAGVVAMLCTPDSAWCTGSVICANGGFKFSV